MKFICAVLFSLVICIAADETTTPYKEGVKCSPTMIKKTKEYSEICVQKIKTEDHGKNTAEATPAPAAAALYNAEVFARFRRDVEDAVVDGTESDQKKEYTLNCLKRKKFERIAKCGLEKLEADPDVQNDLKTLKGFCNDKCIAAEKNQNICLVSQIIHCTNILEEWENKYGGCDKVVPQKESTAAN